MFDPSVGSQTLTYTVYSANHVCSNYATTNVTVDAVPGVPTPGSYGPYCETHAPVVLGGSPSGGVWSGTGVSLVGSDWMFDPSVGSQTLTYTVYSTNHVCSNFATTGVVVDAVPGVPTPGSYGPYCETHAPVVLGG